MTKTLTAEVGLVSLVLIFVLLVAPVPARAQTTAWGDPDFQGIWTNQTPIPLERPDELAGKEFFTEEEAAEFERTALERLLDGATEHLRLVERFTPIDANTIMYQLTVTDPETFASPWTLEQALRKSDDLMFEDACHEGNYSMVGILAGARAEEKR